MLDVEAFTEELNGVHDLLAEQKEAVDKVFNRLSLPEPGQEFTEEQDTAVMGELARVIEEHVASTEHESVITTLVHPGDLSSNWLNKQPYTRGYSDNELLLAVIAETQDDVAVSAGVFLDFEFGDVYVGAFLPTVLGEVEEEAVG